MLLAHCTTFDSPTPSTDGGGADATASLDTGAPDGKSTNEVTFLEARTTPGKGGTDVVPLLPAPAKAGDALVAFWLTSTSPIAPALEWQLAGSVTIGPAGSQSSLWVGSHVLTAAEVASQTPFKFIQKNDGPQEITLLVFRGARPVDPANPVKVQASSSNGPITGLPFDVSPSGPSRAVFAFASASTGTQFPGVPAGFTELARTTGSLVVYQRSDMFPAGATVTPPTIVLPDVGPVGSAALGIIAAP
ncbi:MAG: hypothetical protein HOO96_35895 [Polyangiaceae bacterium]|nr:hypothetical protein [Polyangiaceae bacterium]